MRTATGLAIALLAVACVAGADTPRATIRNAMVDLSVYGPWKDGGRRVRGWADAVGERVVAEGLAWGVGEKGLGQRVILDYGHIYVDGDQLPEGKLVRVVGRLERRHMAAAPPFAQGYTGEFDYFCIKAESVQPLEQVKAPRLTEPTEQK